MNFSSWPAGRLFALAIALVLAGVCPPLLPAQNGPDPGKKPVLRELWIPQAQFEPLLKLYPKGVLLEGKAYQQLLNEAIPEMFPEGQPRQRALLVSADVKATVSAEMPEVLPVTAVIKARIVRDGWAEVALPPVMAYPGSVKIEGEAAYRFAGKLEEGEKQKQSADSGLETLLLRGKAGDIITVTMEGYAPITFGAEGRGVELRSPGAAVSQLELTLPKGSAAKSNLPVTQKDNVALLSWRAGDARARVTWSAGTENRLERGGLRQEGAAAFVFEGDRALGTQELRLGSPLKPLPGQLTISLPPETRPLRVEGADLLSWEVAGNNLKITLQAGERRETTLLVETDRPGADRGAQRVVGTVHLYAREGVRLQHIETGAGLIASPAALPTTPAVEAALPSGQLVGAFFYFNRPGDLTVWARQMTGRFAADLDSRYQLGRHGVEGEHILRLRMLEGERFFHRVTLPDGETLSRVEIEMVEQPAAVTASGPVPAAQNEVKTTAPPASYEWRQEGNSVLLSWKNGLRPGGPEPVTHLHTRRDPADWAKLDSAQQVAVALTSPIVEDAEKIAGYVAVDGDQSLELETTSARGLEARDSRSTPVTGRLAWFRLKDFALGLNVRRKTAEFEARLTAYALPLLQTTEIEGQIALDIRSSGLKTLQVGLNASAAPHLRFEGAEVASRVWDEKTRLWTLTFREELTGQPKLRFRLSLPHLTVKAEAGAPEKTAEEQATARFSASLPVITVPAARRVSGVWLIESNTDTEVSIAAEGLDEADSLRPERVEGYTPRHRLIAAYGYLGNQYKLDLSGVRHQSADLPAVIVDDCRVLSVVTREGRVMHQLSLRLRSNGRQFFPVGLPAGEGLRLLSLVVDGTAAKPVAGPNGAVMIPLPQDAGQGRQVLAQLVYEGSGAQFLSSGNVRVQPPVFDAKTPVLSAGWDLILPEGFTYHNWKSSFLTPEEPQPKKIAGPLLGGLVEGTGDLMRGRQLRSARIRNMVETMNSSAADVGSVAYDKEDMKILAEVGAADGVKTSISKAEPQSMASDSRGDITLPTAPDAKLKTKPGEESEKPSHGGLAQRAMQRIQANMAQAESAVYRGIDAEKSGDYETAVREYQMAVTLLPESPETARVREDAKARYVKAGTIYARQRGKGGRMDEARVIAATMASYDPHNRKVKQLIADLEDPLQFPIAVTPEHVAKANEVNRQLKMGQGFYEVGDLDRADVEYTDVLRKDKYNRVARRGQEKVEQERNRYYESAYDHTRATMLSKVDAQWETSVPPIDPASLGRRRAGILPLLIELPEKGIHVQLIGDHAPQALDFGYVTWERGVRMAWLAILGGALLYGGLVFRRRRWIFLFLVGAVLLTFVPPLFGAAAVRLGNGLLLGWLGMFFIKMAAVIMRPRPAVVTAPATATVPATAP